MFSTPTTHLWTLATHSRVITHIFEHLWWPTAFFDHFRRIFDFWTHFRTLARVFTHCRSLSSYSTCFDTSLVTINHLHTIAHFFELFRDFSYIFESLHAFWRVSIHYQLFYSLWTCFRTLAPIFEAHRPFSTSFQQFQPSYPFPFILIRFSSMNHHPQPSLPILNHLSYPAFQHIIMYFRLLVFAHYYPFWLILDYFELFSAVF